MDPRKTRFSPYEVRGGPGGGARGGFRGGNQAPHQQQQQQQRDDFYGRANGGGGGGPGGEPRRNMFNNDRGMSGGGGGGGAMMRAKGSRFQPQQPQQHQQYQQQRPSSEYNDFMNTSNLSRSSFNSPSPSSYQTAPPRRTGQSRWEPKKESWDEDRVSLNNDDDSRRSVERLPSHIEQRVAREKPCRTLFVRNIQYNLKAHEIKEMYEKFGEVKEVFNLIESRGMVFVTFHDIRAAERAKEATQGMFLANRRIDVHYSLPKEEEENAKCDRSKNQGTLLFTLKNTEAWLQDDQLYDYFAQFGEVKIIRTPHFRHHTENNERRQRFVEFFDSRACVDAFDNCHGKEYKGGRWDVSFFWDHTNRERSEAFAAKKERPADVKPAGRSDRRDNDRRPRGGRDFSRSRRHNDDDRRGSHDDSGRGARFGRGNNRSISPRGVNRRYDPEIPSYTSNEDNQRLEQAQKAQQVK
ncbi:hypothetical protein BDB00DRAFT_134806 [Zychaea mexicana]|uniref:uncharacterized protein n=1 Tax=Zychaea mexicana TaxID=64656 RepID=UPI0022FED826|nr:uncharacterized protein BDB00DRAFT_134806 [Zychaea mexicana]KAI9484472.1 hypothetical protein BDB00DRAFT_134806 [Zychaea mexicana]